MNWLQDQSNNVSTDSLNSSNREKSAQNVTETVRLFYEKKGQDIKINKMCEVSRGNIKVSQDDANHSLRDLLNHTHASDGNGPSAQRDSESFSGANVSHAQSSDEESNNSNSKVKYDCTHDEYKCLFV